MSHANKKVRITSAPQPYVGLNLIAPYFYRPGKYFVDAGPTSSVRLDTTSAATIDANGWPVTGAQNNTVISYDTFAPNSWPTGSYTLSWTGSGNVAINLPGASTPPTFSITNATDRILLLPSGQVSSLSLRPTGMSGQFTPTFLSRAQKATCLRLMDVTYTNYGDVYPTATQRAIEIEDSGSLRYYHHGWNWQDAVDISNAAQCDLWVNVPHLKYNDTGYLTAMATTLSACAKKCYVEFSNETWNGGFPVNSWIPTVAGGQNVDAWHADRSDIIAELFKGISAKFVGVLGSQAVAYGKFTSYTTLATRPLNFIDALAIGPYWGGSWALNTPAATINATSIASAISTIEADYMSNWAPAIPEWKTRCDSKGWDLIAYEGGSHLFAYLNANDSTQAAAIQKLKDINASSEMAALYDRLLDHWKQSGGGLFNHFGDVDDKTWGPWITESQSTPRWDSLASRMRAA